jgi:hypothetical protein
MYTLTPLMYVTGMPRPLTKPLRLQLRLSDTEMAQIDALRRREADIPTRSEMLLRVLAEAFSRKQSRPDDISRKRDQTDD